MKYLFTSILLSLCLISTPTLAAKPVDICSVVYDGTEYIVSAVHKAEAAWKVSKHRHDKLYVREPNEAFQLSLRDVLHKMNAMKVPAKNQVTVLWYIMTEYENGSTDEDAETRAYLAKTTCLTLEE